MITELVLFDLPQGMTREEVVAGMRKVAPAWRQNPELVRKNFLYDPERGQAGGVYTWPSVAAAQRGHDEAWRKRIREMYGADPVIRYFETPVLVDNAMQQTIEAADVA
ncbi:MAG: YdhR family protein [Burkholderiales bacterium]|nr:YdhR family protein [Burkholderiales bacterium]